MRVAGAVRAVALEEHEPLRPVAVGVLRRVGAQQQVAHRRRAAQGQQHLQRTLADVARAPAAARVLLQPARRQVMHERVVDEPGHDLGELCDAAGQRAVRRRAQAQPRQRRRVGSRGRRDEAAVQCQPALRRGAELDAQEGLRARAAVDVQQFVAADALEARARRRLDDEAAAREASREIADRWRRDEQAAAVEAADLRRAAAAAVVAGQRDVLADEPAQRRALRDVDVERQPLRCVERAAAHREQPVAMAIDPAAAFGLDLEGRGHAEQLPAVVELDEHAQAVRAEQPQVAVHGGQEAVDADMALRDHRMEHAGHPGGRGQRALVGHELRAGAQDVAVRPQHLRFLGAQHDVARVAAEEREQRVAVALFVAPRRCVPGGEFAVAEVERFEHRPLTEQRRGRRLAGPGRRCQWPRGFGQCQRRLDEREVGLAAGRRVVGQAMAEEAQRCALAGRQHDGRVLQRHRRVLVLQPPGRQPLHQSGRRRAAARTPALDLQGIGGERGRALQRAEQGPGMAAADGEVLARGDDPAALVVGQWREVDVMADVMLVQPQCAIGREGDVLDPHQFQRLHRVTGVADLDAPEPGRRVLRQHQLDLPLQARGRAGRAEAIAAEVQARRAGRAEQRQKVDAIGALPAQPQAGRRGLDLAADEQAQHVVAAAATAHAAVREDLEPQARAAAQDVHLARRVLRPGAAVPSARARARGRHRRAPRRCGRRPGRR